MIGHRPRAEERSLPLPPGARTVSAPRRGLPRRVLSRIRHGSRQRFDRLLARLIGRRASAAMLDPSAIRSVLVCRVNGRLGNAVLLAAMLRELHALMPQADIDVATAHPEAAQLLGPLPGVRRVIEFPHGQRLVRRFLRAAWQLRRRRYDLALDPAPSSTSGRMALMLARAHWRGGFAVPGQWAPLTHAVPPPPENEHRALQPLRLVEGLFGVECEPPGRRPLLALPEAVVADGRARIERALGRRATAIPVGFFANAAGGKRLDAAWWQAFLSALLELEPDLLPVEFLPLQRDHPLDARFPSLRFPSVAVFAGAAAATRLFVSTDSGPLHVAASTPVPTIGLFRATDPALYRPLKPTDLAVRVTQLSPVDVANQVHNHWRSLIAAASPAG